MSYETSPILNRIKIAKGWTSPTFPTKTLNYSQEVILWFKIYLFLKIYLWGQNIRLLTCEIRLSEAHTKIVYLSMSKHIKKKKNAKSKWKTKSFLQNLQSPLIKAKNKKTRFLLYRDLKTLKKKSEFFFNMNRKKKISKFWISKSRRSSWINFSHLIYRERLFQIKEHKLFFRKKKYLSLRKHKGKTLKRVLFKSKNLNPLTLPTKTTTLQAVLKKKQKNIFGLLIKYQKDILFLEKFFDRFLTLKFKQPLKSFQALFFHLRKEYKKRKKFLKKIKKIYYCYSLEKRKTQTTPASIFTSKIFANFIFQKKINNEIKKHLFFLKRHSNFFQKTFYFYFVKNKRIFNESKRGLKYSFLQFLSTQKKSMPAQKLEHPSFRHHIYKMLCVQHFQFSLKSPHIYSFKTPTHFRESQIFKFLRFQQKNTLDDITTNLCPFPKKNYSHVKNTVSKKGPPQKNSYRLFFRYQYRTYVTLATDLKLKYLITNFIQEYFSLVTHVKFVWPLKKFKNLNFYRLIFPTYKQLNFNKTKTRGTLKKRTRLKKKRYLYIGQNTDHLQIGKKLITEKNKFWVYKKISQKTTLQLTNQHSKSVFSKNMLRARNKTKIMPKLNTGKNTKNTSFLNLVNNQSTQTHLSQFWRKEMKLKTQYLIFKKKVMKTQSEKRLFWASKAEYIPNLTRTFILFAKYLEPQALADHLAKIISETKKHANILKTIKGVLKTISFKRGLGYRIALIGRINGANKSRTFYLKKLNRNRSRQTFSKNVNFAMAQARATIGTFGIKIWVYF